MNLTTPKQCGPSHHHLPPDDPQHRTDFSKLAELGAQLLLLAAAIVGVLWWIGQW